MRTDPIRPRRLIDHVGATSLAPLRAIVLLLAACAIRTSSAPGRFSLQSWQKGRELVAVKNPDYWQVTEIHVIAAYEDGVHVLRPQGMAFDIEVTRRLDGDEMVWGYGPMFTARCRRVD